MKARIFKTGDKVMHRKGGPVMTVEKYATNYRPLMGWDESDFLVICQWRGERRFHREIIHQSNLTETQENYSMNNFSLHSGYVNHGMNRKVE